MSRDVVELALRRHHRRDVDPAASVARTLADYDAALTGRLRDFTPVFTTSDGSDCPATELRCALRGCLIQGVGPHTLLDLIRLAARHDCQTTREGDRT